MGLLENIFASLVEGRGVMIPAGPVYRVTSAFEKIMRFLDLEP